MATMGVCGASWMAATQNLNRADCVDSSGRHFTEILARKLNYNYSTLARGGLSNSAIRLQVEEMIHRRVDFVILGNDTENRIEIPTNSGFDSTLGIYNINYRRTPDLSALDPGFVHDNLESDTLNNFFDKKGNRNKSYLENLTDEHFDAVKHYTTYLYDSKFRQLQDLWIIESAIAALRHAKIPYLFLPCDECDITQSRYLSRPDVRIVSDGSLSLQRYGLPTVAIGPQRRWHTTDSDQIKIANDVCEYIQTHGLLNWQ
jgi:hypothetical protein